MVKPSVPWPDPRLPPPPPDTGSVRVSTPRPNGISTPLSWRVRFAMWRARMQLNAGLRLDWLWLTRRGAERLVRAFRMGAR